MKPENPSSIEHPNLAILMGALENTREAFVTIDENHKVVFFNRAAERFFGVSGAEAVGRDFNRILGPRCSRDHRQAVRRYLETGIPRRIGHETELTLTRRTGESFPVSVSFSVAHIEGRIFFTGILRDLTETRALQEQVTKTERLAALGQLAAEITHEIKNPLVIIGATMRQVLRRTKDEKSRDRLEIVVAEVKRLEGLLAELNEYYRPGTMVMERIDVNALLREICALAGQECKRKKIHLTCHIGENPIWVRGDRDKLKQVFLNLVRNGIEAMEEKGRLSVQSMLTERVEIQVADSGPGIPEKDQSKIFAPFFTTKSGGSGLGLAVSKKIIDGHPGSTIGLLSQKGKGTVFKIQMPRWQEEE
jgi:two-component system sensor kinase FixL